MGTVFSGHRWNLLIEYLPRGLIITSASYFDILLQLKQAIKYKPF